MPPEHANPLLGPFLTTADAFAQATPDVDIEIAREVFREAATLLHDGLALDGLDDHDARVVVVNLCIDLVAADPGAAVRRRAQATLEDPRDLHHPDTVSAAYLSAAAILQI